MTDATLPVLIVGAGPTGLVLALTLARHGVPFRIIDRNSGPGQASRAMVVHARTLELYRQLGIADAIVSAGIRVDTLHLREGGHEAAQLALGHIGAGMSPYPYVLCLPQDDHERLLVRQLEATGARVEWQTTLTTLESRDDYVLARLRGPGDGGVAGGGGAAGGGGVAGVAGGAAGGDGDSGGESEPARFSYVCGCDGARSTVREQLAIGFPGGSYQHLYYVADVSISGEGGAAPNRDLYVNLGADTFALMLPVRSSGTQRLIGLMPDAGKAGDPHDHQHDGGAPGRVDTGASFEDVRAGVEPLLGVKVAQVHWFSTYRVHHRVASAFRAGRCFIAGDAAHIHSPAGGQGMNTGIGDAVNLGWKLAQVLHGRAGAALLDTYEAERIVFARQLVASTDRAFQAMVSQGLGGELLRTWLLPHALPLLASFAGARRAMFRMLSQIHIEYRDSPLSAGRAGEVLGGDRLPWLVPDGHHDGDGAQGQSGTGAGAQGDSGAGVNAHGGAESRGSGSGSAGNFAALASMDWQLHVYGEVDASLAAQAAALNLPLHVYPWSDAASDAGLLRDAAYLVRPDGHVGLALPRQQGDTLHDYIGQHGLRFGSGQPWVWQAPPV